MRVREVDLGVGFEGAGVDGVLGVWGYYYNIFDFLIMS